MLFQSPSKKKKRKKKRRIIKMRLREPSSGSLLREGRAPRPVKACKENDLSAPFFTRSAKKI